MSIRSTKKSLALIAIALGSSCSGALAQSPAPAPSLVQPPTIATPPASTRITLPQIAAGSTVPDAAKKLTFILTGIDIEGEFDEIAIARKEAAATLLGKSVTVADLFGLADKLQQAYVRAGYPLVRIVILPQELDRHARVKLRVIDGYVEKFDTSTLSGTLATRVAAVLAPLLNKRRLTQNELERKLLIAGDTPGLVLNATFAAGSAVGGSVLVLSGRYRPVSASLYLDNGMPKSFGEWQAATYFSLNNLTGFGEQLSISIAGLPDNDFVTPYPTRRYLGANLAVPLGIDGWRFELGVTDGRTTPRVDAIFASQGIFRQGRAKLAYDVVKRRDTELSFNARFDLTEEQVSTLITTPATPLSLDRTRVPRVGLDGILRLRESGTTLTYTATYSHGINALGARSIADATPLLPLSRQGADAEFSKLDGRIDVMQTLPENLFLSAGLAGQTSFGRPMLTSEQFPIIGANMLSGFAAGTLAGDTGWVGRGEFGWSTQLPFLAEPHAIVPYVFAATGERRYEMPTILEIPVIRANNYGGGMRFQLAPQAPDAPSLSGFVELSERRASASSLDGWMVFAGGSLRY
jgi:hemolysin activation/secretion protein